MDVGKFRRAFRRLSRAMNIVKIRETETKYQDCEKCSLCTNREHNPHFGMGHPEGKILIVIPEPYLGKAHDLRTKDLYDNAPIQNNHRLYKPFNSLLTSAKISKLDTYVVPTIMCPSHEGERPAKEDILHCRDRLRETIQAFNPTVLVLCGPISYFAWYKEVPPADKEYGILLQRKDQYIYYTRSVDNFLDLHRSKRYSEEEMKILSDEVLSNWTEIGALARK